MTDKPENTPSETDGDKPKSSNVRNAAIGAAATIGSAAIAAALLYAGKRFSNKSQDSALGPDQADTPPSGEPPETD